MTSSAARLRSLLVGRDQLDFGDFQTRWATCVSERPDAGQNQVVGPGWQFVFAIPYARVECEITELENRFEATVVLKLHRWQAGEKLAGEFTVGVRHSDSEKYISSGCETATDDEV